MAVPERPEGDPRIYFAAERTLLAWIRTGMALMGFGFVVARFSLLGPSLSAGMLPRWFGASLVVSGVLVTTGALAVHVRTVRRLQRGEPYTGQPAWLAVATGALLAAGGIVLTVYLLT